MNTPYIYLILDKVKNKRPYYVGKHNGDNKNYITGSKILRRYIKMFGIDAFFIRFEKIIIEYCNIDNLNLLEEKYIKFYQTKTYGGNLTDGGRWDLKYRLPKSKPVLQYDLEGNFIKEWINGKEAWRNINRGSYGDISACCLGSQPTALGYIWKYKNGDIINKIEPYKRKKHKKRITSGHSKPISIDGISYRSILHASRELNMSESKLRKFIKQNKLNFKWL